MKENWKTIKGFEDYMVSDKGRIKSFKNDKEVGRILVTIVGSRKYPLINLMKDGKMNQFTVHRLVALHFLKNEVGHPFVNHIDLNKENNNVVNLEWCTARENITHYYKSQNTLSEYAGVFRRTQESGYTYVVQVQVGGARCYMGIFNDEVEASKVYFKSLEIYDRLGIAGVTEYKRSLRKKYSSKYRNVSYDKARSKWGGSIFHKGKQILKKRFVTEEEALKAVIEKYLEYGIPLHHTHKL